MPCYSPISAWQVKNPITGKLDISFSNPSATITSARKPIKLPCGQCIGCRLERSRQWAVRCNHEASLYENNCFITLTYDDHHLPSDGSLHKEHFQKFMKRLRKKFPGSKIRYFHCGEYGDELSRPHYHAILFNFDFQDKEVWKIKQGNTLYRSATLEKLWTFGYSTIGDVTFESAAYVARYCTKKVTGKEAEAHYGDKQPEYTTMSRRPGIAADWFKKYSSDVYPSDQIVIRNNIRCKPPRYYDNLYEVDNPNEMSKIKIKRKTRAEDNPDNSPERLEVRHNIQKLKAKRLIREYESQ